MKPTDFSRSIGDRAIDLRHYDLDLSVARANVRFSLAGTFLYSPPVAFDSALEISSSLATGICLIRFGKQTGTPTYYAAGAVHNRDPYDELFITNTAQPGKMLRLYYGVGNAMMPFVNDQSVSLAGGSTFDSKDNQTVATLATTNVAPALPGRSEVILENLSASDAKIGDSGAGATNGVTFKAGERITLTTADDVFVYNPSGAGIDIAVAEVF